MTKYSEISRDNNFDLVRLFAALQVVFFHIQNRLEIYIPNVKWFSHLPGVPIFFTVSGFLITASFLRSNSLKSYFIKRYLRIYPAIYALIILTTVSCLVFGCFGCSEMLTKQYLKWVVKWCSYDQNCSPPLMSSFGIGTPNGSLWTIPVELSFYILLPLFFCCKRRLWLNVIAVTLCIVSLLTNYLFFSWDWFFQNGWQHTFSMSLIPHLFWFLFGALMYINWDVVKSFVENKFFVYFSFLVCFTLLDAVIPVIGTSVQMQVKTGIGLMMNILLSLTTISAAFSFTRAARMLKGYDISYGVYLYHGLLINVWIEMSDIRSYWVYSLIYVLTIVAGLISWIIVEKPCLALKNRI